MQNPSRAVCQSQHENCKPLEIANPKCARTVCQSPHDNCKHSHDGRLYCEHCAVKINRANPDHPDLVSIPRKEEAKFQMAMRELAEKSRSGNMTAEQHDEERCVLIEREQNRLQSIK